MHIFELLHGQRTRATHDRKVRIKARDRVSLAPSGSTRNIFDSLVTERGSVVMHWKTLKTFVESSITSAQFCDLHIFTLLV